MTFREVIPGLWGASRAGVNVFALTDRDGVTLIDTGYPDFVPAILKASAPLGRVKNIVVTHAHPDHADGLKGLVDRTGAVAWMHPDDASLVRQGRALRPYTPAPTPLAGGLEVYHLPGHSAGQVALGCCAPDGQRVVFAADVLTNLFGLGEPFVYGDRPLGLRSTVRLAALARDADLPVMGHGRPLRRPGRSLERLAQTLNTERQV